MKNRRSFRARRSVILAILYSSALITLGADIPNVFAKPQKFSGAPTASTLPSKEGRQMAEALAAHTKALKAAEKNPRSVKRKKAVAQADEIFDLVLTYYEIVGE